MALFKHGPLAAEIRGSIAGATYSRNKAGAYIRNRSKPVNPMSARQVAVRLKLSSLQTIWHNTLSTTERQAWDAFAAACPMLNRLGETQPISGFNHFLRINALRLIPGLAITIPPPIPPAECDIKGFTASATSASGFQITAKDANLVAGDHIIFSWNNPLTQAVNFYKGPYAHLTDWDGSTTLPLTLTATAAIGNRFHYAWRAFDANNRVSAMMHKYVDCTT
jgi:hypothetical protein